MSTRSIVLAALAFAAIGAAQTAPQSKTFDFANKPSPQSLQEAATILRTVGDIRQLTVDSAASTITVEGTPDELSMTAWIVRALDQPLAPSPSPSVYSEPYLVAGKSDDLIRIFHLGNIPKEPQPLQELLTTLRTVGDIQKVFNYTSLNDLVVRGTASQMALAEYLLKALDVVPGSVTSATEYPYKPPVIAPRGPANEVVRVFYLATMEAPRQIQEILTVLRTVNDIQRIFNYTPLNALVVRASDSDMAAVDWVIKSLDLPATAKPDASAGPREYVMTGPGFPASGNIIRVFYPPHISTPKGLQETLTLLRTKLSIQKVFNYSALNALVVRGSADQITKAEQLIQAQDQLAKATP